MSEKTNIAWATSTGNPWLGCTKVSPGCKNCYAAELDAQRFSKTMGGGTKENPESHWGKGAPRVRTKAFWNDARQWEKAAAGTRHHGGECPRIFPSLCDWLDDEVPIEWLADFLKLIHDTPNLDWLLLTKRPENFHQRIKDALWRLEGLEPEDEGDDESLPATDAGHMLNKWIGNEPPANIWIGVSVEDQKRADERIPLLLQIPAKVRFLSVEPLLERVDFSLCANPENISEEEMQGMITLPHCLERIDWVIVGGESGKDRRDCGVEAICDVARQCVAAGAPVFTKQDCAFKPGQQGRIPEEIWRMKDFPKL